MTKAIENAIERIQKHLSLNLEDGDPLELVPVKMSAESKARLHDLLDGASWAADAIARLDAPQMVPRILLEARDRSTERGRAHRVQMDRAINGLLAARTDGARPIEIIPRSAGGPLLPGAPR